MRTWRVFPEPVKNCNLFMLYVCTVKLCIYSYICASILSQCSQNIMNYGMGWLVLMFSAGVVNTWLSI